MKTIQLKLWVALWFLYSSCLLLLSHFSAFKLLGVPIMTPSFADLRFITTSVDCYLNGNWSMTGMSCDPWGRPFNYPSLWIRLFALFRLGESQTIILGSIEIVILSASLIYWTRWAFRRLESPAQKSFFPFLVFLIFFSPPILLLAERGNVDILIFAGVTLAYIVYSKYNFFIAGFLIAFLGILKLYPFLALVSFFERERKKSHFFLLLAFGFFGFLSLLSEIQLIALRSVNDWNSISYGVSVLPLLVMKGAFSPNTKIWAAVLGALVLFILAIFITGLKSNRLESSIKRTLSRHTWDRGAPLISLIFVGSFLSGTAYDYRLVTLIPVLFILFVSTRSYTSAGLMLIVTFISMYFGHLTSQFGRFGLFLNATGDMTITLIVALLISVYIDRLFVAVHTRRKLDVQN